MPWDVAEMHQDCRVSHRTKQPLAVAGLDSTNHSGPWHCVAGFKELWQPRPPRCEMPPPTTSQAWRALPGARPTAYIVAAYNPMGQHQPWASSSQGPAAAMGRRQPWASSSHGPAAAMGRQQPRATSSRGPEDLGDTSPIRH